MKAITIYIIIFSIILLVISCEKLPEEVNKTYHTPDLTYCDAEQIEALVAVSYAYLRLWYGKEDGAMLGDGGTDIWMDAKDGVANLEIVRYQGLSENSTNFPVDEVWEYLWNAINVVNFAENYVDGSNVFTKDRKNQLLSEVKFLRAFYYWHLVETWGAVPLKTDPATNPSTAVQRDPVDQIYAQMIRDVQFGIDHMDPNTAPGSRISYWAAKALKARLALTYAGDYYKTTIGVDYKGTDYYAMAAMEALDVINNGPKTLAADYRTIWDIEFEAIADNPEMIWGVDYYNVIAPDNFANRLPQRQQDDWNKTIARIYHEAGGNGNAQHLWYTPRWNFNKSFIGGPPNNDVLVRYIGAPAVGVNVAGISPVTGNDTSYRQVIDLGNFYYKYGMGYTRCAPTRYLLELFNPEADQRYEATLRTVYYKHPQVAPTGWPGPECFYPDMLMGTDTDTAFFYSNTPITAEHRAWARTRYKVIDIDTLYNADGTYRMTGSEGTSDHMFPALKKFEDTAPEHPPSEAYSSSFNHYFSYRDFPVFRISEMYLIAAEALLEENPAQALALMNTLRQSRAIKGMEASMTLQEIDLDMILEERALELIGENLRWFDLKRTNKLEDQMVHNPRAGQYFDAAKHYLRPIPATQMKAVANRTDGPQPGGFWQNTNY